MAEITREAVVDYLSNLPVIQIAELIKELENKWGVKAAPAAGPVARGPARAGPAPGEGEDEVRRRPNQASCHQVPVNQGVRRNHRPRFKRGEEPGRASAKTVKEQA